MCVITPYIIFYPIKVIRQYLRQIADKAYTPVKNSNIYNVEGNNRLSPGLQLLITGSVLKLPLCFQSGSIIVLSLPETILLSSAKHSSHQYIIVANTDGK